MASSRGNNAAMTIAYRCPVCNGPHGREERTLDDYPLVACADCGMVYVWPRPARDTSRASYAAGRRGATADDSPPALGAADLFALYENEHTPYVEEALGRRLDRFARRRPIRRMLDFGCGSGHLLGLARARLGCETFGIELHPVAELGARRFGFTLHAGLLEDVPFPAASFDLVYCAQVLEHLPEPGLEVARLVALLAPGGLLFVEVPNYGSLAIRLHRDPFTNNRPPGHLNYFRRGPLRRLLSGAGLELLSVRTPGVPHRAIASGRTAPARPTAAAAPSPNRPFGRGTRARFRVLAAADALIGLPGWGLQLEAIARQPQPGTSNDSPSRLGRSS